MLICKTSISLRSFTTNKIVTWHSETDHLIPLSVCKTYKKSDYKNTFEANNKSGFPLVMIITFPWLLTVLLLFIPIQDIKYLPMLQKHQYSCLLWIIIYTIVLNLCVSKFIKLLLLIEINTFI